MPFAASQSPPAGMAEPAREPSSSRWSSDPLPHAPALGLTLTVPLVPKCRINGDMRTDRAAFHPFLMKQTFSFLFFQTHGRRPHAPARRAEMKFSRIQEVTRLKDTCVCPDI